MSVWLMAQFPADCSGLPDGLSYWFNRWCESSHSWVVSLDILDGCIYQGCFGGYAYDTFMKSGRHPNHKVSLLDI